ncbi:MAG: ECF transporter S component [Ignisphaera sp.]
MKFQDIVRIAIYTAITFIATAILVIETPATGGYFNLGEASIYVIASISNPIVTAIASGLGPAIADIVLGYGYFAPATFAIKFCEGFIVSKLISKVRATSKSSIINVAVVILGVILALAIALPIAFYRGEEHLSIELGWIHVSGTPMSVPYLYLALPSYIWIVIAIAVIVMSIAVICIARLKPYVLPMILGGMVMVLGYFLYEYFVSNPLILGKEPIAALAEVPINIGQFSAGVVIAYPVVQFIERAKGVRGKGSEGRG